jgi:hypothetical protein
MEHQRREMNATYAKFIFLIRVYPRKSAVNISVFHFCGHDHEPEQLPPNQLRRRFQLTIRLSFVNTSLNGYHETATTSL